MNRKELNWQQVHRKQNKYTSPSSPTTTTTTSDINMNHNVTNEKKNEEEERKKAAYLSKSLFTASQLNRDSTDTALTASSSGGSAKGRGERHGNGNSSSAAATSTATGGGGGGSVDSGRNGRGAVHEVNAVKIPPGHQALEHAYAFWFFTKQRGQGPVDYEARMKRIGEFASVEGFWEFFSHLKRPSEMQVPADYHLFRKDIKPMWEDPNNKDGGKWLIRVKKEYSDRLWEDLLLAIVGNQFEASGYDEINGAVMSMRETHDVIALWNRTSDSKVIKDRIRETLRHVLKLPHRTILEYRSHSPEAATTRPNNKESGEQPLASSAASTTTVRDSSESKQDNASEQQQSS